MDELARKLGLVTGDIGATGCISASAMIDENVKGACFCVTGVLGVKGGVAILVASDKGASIVDRQNPTDGVDDWISAPTTSEKLNPDSRVLRPWDGTWSSPMSVEKLVGISLSSFTLPCSASGRLPSGEGNGRGVSVTCRRRGDWFRDLADLEGDPTKSLLYELDRLDSAEAFRLMVSRAFFEGDSIILSSSNREESSLIL